MDGVVSVRQFQRSCDGPRGPLTKVGYVQPRAVRQPVHITFPFLTPFSLLFFTVVNDGDDVRTVSNPPPYVALRNRSKPRRRWSLLPSCPAHHTRPARRN